MDVSKYKFQVVNFLGLECHGLIELIFDVTYSSPKTIVHISQDKRE